jgi:pimeloyl-ACP methyl ester carboxylesterase
MNSQPAIPHDGELPMSQIENVTAQQGQYVEANGLNIYYEEYGSGEPLILLHGGLGAGSIQWGAHVPLLSSHFRVIMPDARGHGRTDNPGGEIRLYALADDVIALIQALDLETPVLCGWSMGGDTAIDVGRRYSNSVKAMVVGGVTHRVSETYFDSLLALGVEGPGQVNTEQTEKAMSQFSAMLQSAHSQGPDHWKTLFTQLSHEMMEPTLPSLDDLRKITAPTLIILGDRDQFIPIEYAVELYQLIPNAELAVVPNADHFVLTNGDLFANLVVEFLLRHTASAKLDSEGAG